MFYSKSTKGFYDSEIHGSSIPNDAKEIAKEHYLKLLEGQSNGKQIVSDDSGFPTLIDATPLVLTYAEQRAMAYPSLQEQLDMQYWDSVNGTTVWQDTINAIKAKYPKVG